MFVLVLMSHGTGGDMILDSQSQPVALTKIKDLLSPHNFAAMKGKPKLMIVQACSGGKYFSVVTHPAKSPITYNYCNMFLSSSTDLVKIG
jgi:hypothetical protein